MDGSPFKNLTMDDSSFKNRHFAKPAARAQEINNTTNPKIILYHL